MSTVPKVQAMYLLTAVYTNTTRPLLSDLSDSQRGTELESQGHTDFMKYVSWKKDKRNLGPDTANNVRPKASPGQTKPMACLECSLSTSGVGKGGSATTIHYVTTSKKVQNEVCHIDTNNTCVVVLRGVHMINS